MPIHRKALNPRSFVIIMGLPLAIAVNLWVQSQLMVSHAIASTPMFPLNRVPQLATQPKWSIFTTNWQKRVPPPLGKRAPGVCLMAPDGGELWNLKPRFVWMGIVRNLELEVFLPERIEKLPGLAISLPVQNKLPQSANYSSRLEPGKTYQYRLNYQQKDNLGNSEFVPSDYRQFATMPVGQRRDTLTKALQALEQKVPAKARDREEQIAWLKANYFLDQGLTSDAIQALFEVSQPSSDLLKAQQVVANSICKD